MISWDLNQFSIQLERNLVMATINDRDLIVYLDKDFWTYLRGQLGWLKTNNETLFRNLISSNIFVYKGVSESGFEFEHRKRLTTNYFAKLARK